MADVKLHKRQDASTSSTDAPTSTPPPPTSSTTTSTPPTTTPPTSTPPDTSTSTTSTSSETSTTSTSSPGASSSNGSTTAPVGGTSRSSSTTAPPTSVSTVIQTTVVVTDPGGATHTSVYATTTLVAAAPTGSSSSGSSSHVGAIVGGTIGGVAGVAALGLLVLFFLRRRRRYSDFDGNFDPDRVVNHAGGGGTLPNVDLAGTEVTPFPLHPGAPPNMAQYHDTSVPGFMPVAGGMGGRPPSHYTTSDYTQSSYYPTSPTSASGHAMPDYPGRHPSPGPSLATNSTSYPGTSVTGRSAKEREAMNARYQNQLGIANPDGPEGGASGSGEVIQHRDGGRLPANEEVEEGPSEIPPRYDEIPADER